MSYFSKFPVDSRVRLVRWAPASIDDHQFVPKGTEGTVRGHGVDQLWVTWDNGSNLSPSGLDRVEAINDKEEGDD